MKKYQFLERAAIHIVALFFLVGCASYQHKVHEAKSLLRQGQPAQAAQLLQPLAEKENDDQLVFLLDYATALHYAGDYEGSNRAFQQADRLADNQDYTSVSRLAGSILLNERLVQYKGDDFEKIFINAFGALNYILLKNSESALVEVRRLNNKLYKLKTEKERDYGDNAFAYYLSALAWEMDGKWDDAFIDYKKSYDILGATAQLKKDLLRAALQARRYEEARKYEREFNLKPDASWRNKEYGELVVFFHQGWGPIKQPNPKWVALPKLYPTFSSTVDAQLTIEGQDQVIPLEFLYSVEKVAIETLDRQYAKLIAKRIAGQVAKRVAADQLRQKNKALGFIAHIGLQLADQADLRQWSTLPREIHVARVFLPAGQYTLHIKGLRRNGIASGEHTTQLVNVEPRRKAFVSWRSFR